MTTPNLYEKTLIGLAESDPEVMIVTSENRAAMRVLPDIVPDRFVDVGIAEQTMIGMAAGMALRGRKPIVHALAAFLTMRAYEFIRTDIGISGLPVKLVGCVPGFLSDGNGPTHQAIEDVAIMRGIPGMEVFCPADEEELAAAMPVLMARPNPCYIRYTQSAPVVAHPLPGQPERIEVLADGSDVALLTHGVLIEQALDARKRLADQGISARVLNVRMLAPIDADAVLAAARDCELVVTLEDHFRTGGLYSIVAELLIDRGAHGRVMPIALDSRWFRPALLPDVLRHEGFTGEAIAARVTARLGRLPGRNRVRPNPTDPAIAESQALWQRAKGLIPAGTQTLAKGPTQHIDGVAPKYLVKGRGARVWDADGNEYLDMTMGLGPLSLGYANPVVDQAIRDQLERGITFSLMNPLEVEVAELIRDVVPNADSVRFSKSGADVTSAAVRVSRAFTGRDHVVCCGYHGWHDWYISSTDRSGGIPEATRALTSTIDYNDLDSVRAAVRDDTACVILEAVRFVEPEPGFLEGLREICDQKGALLVFDEMWTGFRIALGGAQEKFGVRADLATFSKAIANGMPISVLTGRQDVMQLFDSELFFYTTFGGEALSLAAVKATIGQLRELGVPAAIAAKGARLKEGYAAIVREHGLDWTRCSGMDYRTVVELDASAGNPLHLKSYVQQELFRRGVLWAGSHTFSYAHTAEDVEYLISCFDTILPALAGHIKKGTVTEALRGQPVRGVFGNTRKPRGDA